MGSPTVPSGTHVFSACSQALETAQSVARSGQNSLAQGLPWVISPTRISSEGATSYGRESAPNLLIGSRALLAPPGQNVYFRLPRVNPGLSFLAPSGRALRAIWPSLNTHSSSRTSLHSQLTTSICCRSYLEDENENENEDDGRLVRLA